MHALPRIAEHGAGRRPVHRIADGRRSPQSATEAQGARARLPRRPGGEGQEGVTMSSAARYRPLPLGGSRRGRRRAAAPTARRCCVSTRAAARRIRERLTDRLVHWAEPRPSARSSPSATQRRRRLAPRQLRARRCERARDRARRCSTAACRAERPVAILSDNDLEHLPARRSARMLAGVPYRAGLAGLFAASRRTTASCATSSAR